MRPKTLVISLDYDDTYTADEGMWKAFIENAQARGHEIIVVSFREDHQMATVRNAFPNLRVFGTNCIPKREFCDKNGIWVDIWIDDLPGTIV